MLGLGVFFLDKFNQSANAGNGTIAARTLFGSIFGLSSSQAQLAALIGIVVVAGVTAIARPLLFATIDPQVAASRGVPVGLVGAGFLVLLGLVAAEAKQAVGALLLLGLIAAPGGAALKLTANAYLALALSCVFALASVVLGIVGAYVIPSLPPISAIIGIAAAIYCGDLCAPLATIAASAVQHDVVQRTIVPGALLDLAERAPRLLSSKGSTLPQLSQTR